MLLEAQLNEAKKHTCSSDTIPSIEMTSDEKQKVSVLEMKTKNLEHQIAVIFSMIENQTKSDKHQNTQHKVYACYDCDYEFTLKEDFKEHMETKHATNEVLCDRDSPTISQKVPNNTVQKSQSCEYKTYMEKELEHLKCNKCSYLAIHNKDLRRHKNTMHVHDEPVPCDLCTYRAIHENDLNRHKQTMHNIKNPHACSTCSYIARNTEILDNHIFVKHSQLRRTRIFSSRRQSTADPQHHQIPKGIQNPESIFRPWSGQQPSSTSAPPTPTPPSSSTETSSRLFYSIPTSNYFNILEN